MLNPGAEYAVILNDRHLREAQMLRARVRSTRQRAHGFRLPRLTWLSKLMSGGVTRFEAVRRPPGEQLLAPGGEPLFGTLD